MDLQGETLHMTGGKEEKEEVQIPEELSILPLSGIVLFPRIVVPLMVGQEYYVQLVVDAVVGDRFIGVAARRQKPDEEPAPESLYRVGTAAKVLKMMKLPTGGMSFLVQGMGRIRIEEFSRTEPYLVARVRRLVDEASRDPEMEALQKKVAKAKADAKNPAVPAK